MLLPYLTFISVNVLFAVRSESLDSVRCLINISFGEDILRLVLEWVFLRVSENESVQESHQGEVRQRIAGIFYLKCNKLMWISKRFGARKINFDITFS